MSLWSDYYKARVGSSYPDYCKLKYEPFILLIQDCIDKFLLTTKELRIREEGCGIATITKILAETYKDTLINLEAFDNDIAQLINAAINLSLKKEIKNCNLYKSSILEKQPKTGIIHSHGVLEHFNDSEIHTILSRQCKEAKYVLHYVPTNFYTKQNFGDERLMSKNWWLKKFKPNKALTFNKGKDLIMLWIN